MEGESGMFLKDERGDGQEREEMREICEGEARDEEETNPDEGDSPHHGLKDRRGKPLKDRWRKWTRRKKTRTVNVFGGFFCTETADKKKKKKQ